MDDSSTSPATFVVRAGVAYAQLVADALTEQQNETGD